MGALSRREWIGVIAILVVVVVVVGVSALHLGQSAVTSSGLTLRETFPQAPAAPPPVRPSTAGSSQLNGTNTANTVSTPSSDSDSPPSSAPEEVVVHVAGAVRHPGVYHLHPGARNDDALKAAGGPTQQANTDAVNLAARVEDGTQLFIPTRKEHPEGGASPAIAAETAAPAMATREERSARSARSGSHGGRGEGSGRSNKLTSPAEGQININTASAEELQRIPGIGPAMAERLISFRQQNGGFHSVEDLMQVSGIGPKKFEKMQPYVRVR